MTTRLVIISCFCASIWTTNMVAAPEAKITLRLVDESDHPWSNMPVRIGFFEEGKQNIGVTDSNGMFSAGGLAITGEATFSVNEQGYYYSRGVYRFPKAGHRWSDYVKDDKWQPWNPVVTMLVKRVVNPTPMYSKHVETMIPATNTAFAYDLMVGDWVHPNGRGVVSDFVFRVQGYWQDYRNNDAILTLSLSKPKDGLIPLDYEMLYGNPAGSALFMPRFASEEGYSFTNKWRKARKQAMGGGQDESICDLKEGRGYLFRVRSTVNEAGVVTNAYYGKIHGDFDFGGSGSNGSSLVFTYYLNSTPNNRNLEFDPKRNLFKK